jgi:mannose-1-phosphate guanylyltransferase
MVLDQILLVGEELDGYIVAESDNVLLICKLEDEQRIRQFVNDVNVNQNGQFS